MATRKRWTPFIGPIGLVQFAFIVTITISLTLLIGFAYKMSTYERIKQEAAQLQARLERVQAEHDALIAHKAYVQSDAYVEKIAREELNFGRPGDTVLMVKVLPSEPPPPTPAPADEAAVPVGPQWQAWYTLFFGDPSKARGF